MIRRENMKPACKKAADFQSTRKVITITFDNCPQTFQSAKYAFEAEFIRVKLCKYAGNVTRTARALEISRKTLTSKIQQFGIDMRALRGYAPESYMVVPLAHVDAPATRLSVCAEK